MEQIQSFVTEHKKEVQFFLIGLFAIALGTGVAVISNLVNGQWI